MQSSRSGGGFTRPSSKPSTASAGLDDEAYGDDSDVFMFGGDDEGGDYSTSQQSKRLRPHALRHQSRSHHHQSHGQPKQRHRLPFVTDKNNADSNSAFGSSHFAGDSSNNNRHDHSGSDSDGGLGTPPARRDLHQPLGIPSYEESFGNLSREFEGLPRAPSGSFAPPPRSSDRHPNQDVLSPPERHVGAGGEHEDDGGERGRNEMDDIRSQDFRASDQKFSPHRYFSSSNAARNRSEYSPREDFLVHAFDSNAMKLEPHESLGGDNQQDKDNDRVAAASNDGPPYALHDAMDSRVAQTFSEARRPRQEVEETPRQPPDPAHHRASAEAFPSDAFAFANNNDYDGMGSEASAASDRVFLGKRVSRFAHSSATSSALSSATANQFDALATRPPPLPPPQSSTSYQPVFPLTQHHDHVSIDRSMVPPRKKSSKKSDGRGASVTTSTALLTPTPTASTASRSPTTGPPSRWLREEDEQLREAVARFGGKNWKMIAETLGNGRTDVQCLHRWNKVLKPGLVKGPWTPEEDGILSQLITRYGVGKIRWCDVAQHLPGRIGKQCRERWCNHLDSCIRKGQWTPEEDDVVFRWQQKLGNKWSEIAKLLPGRTENAVKNRFNSAARRKWMMRVASTPASSAMTPTGASNESTSANLAGASSTALYHDLLRRPPPSPMIPASVTQSLPHHHSPPGLLSPSRAFLFTRRDPMSASGINYLNGPDGMLRFDVEGKRPAGMSNGSAPIVHHLHFFQQTMTPPPPRPPLLPPSSINLVDRPPHEPPNALLRPPPPPSMGTPLAELPIGLSLPAATFAPPPPPLFPPPPAGFSFSSAFAMASEGVSSMDDAVDREPTERADAGSGSTPLAEHPTGYQCGAEGRVREQRPAVEPAATASGGGHDGMMMPAMDDENMSRFLDSVALELEDMME